MDCGKEIDHQGRSIRCNSCSLKNRWANKEFRKKILSRPKKGRSKGYCVDCGKGITLHCTRCHSCSTKHAGAMRKLWQDAIFQTKMSIGRRGKDNPNWKGGKWKKKNAFLDKIRRSARYLAWKNEILKRDVRSFPNVPKNVQVHHIKSLGSIVRENNITTMSEALLCLALWDTNNGVCLMKSEHMIITWMNRAKKHSQGFIEFLEAWIALNEGNAKDIGR